MSYTILQDGYSFSPYNDTVITIEPSVGMMYAQRITLDEPFVFNVNIETTDRDGFEAWAQSVAETGFTEQLQIEAGSLVDVDVVFTERGYPQFQSKTADTYRYSAQLFANAVNNPDAGEYATLVGLAEMSSDKDPETTMNLLDIIVNDIWPEV